MMTVENFLVSDFLCYPLVDAKIVGCFFYLPRKRPVVEW
jgi:hypothetical protein